MTVAASTTAFAVVFGVFVVAVVVLVVLTLRFTFRRAAASREARPAGGSADDEEGDQEEDEEESEGLTALVLAGGGTRGAVQVGMLQVLAEHGFVPDRVYGSSVGAVNGVGFAADPTRAGVGRMVDVWLGLSGERVYPQGRLHGPWLYFQQRDAVYPNRGLRAVLEDAYACERLEEARVPVEVVATSLTDGQAHWFTYGPAVDAVLASAAMPAIFPPVEIEGDRYIDGGVVDNVPIQRAVEAGATRIVVLLCSPPLFTPPPFRRPVEGMVNALLISIHARFARDMAALPEGVEVILCVGPEGATRDFDDFSTTEQLLAQGREEASEIVRRYGLGTVPYPAPPAPVPTLDPVASSDPTGSGGPTRSPEAVGPAPDSPGSPLTQPRPGT